MKTLFFLQNKCRTKKILHTAFLSFFLLFLNTAIFSQTTETFNYTGDIQTWIVPPGVSAIHVELAGAQGGAGFGSNGVIQDGGLGATVEGDFMVNPGQEFFLFVGGQGQMITDDGNIGGEGWNGGGSARGFSTNGRGGGGGASDIRTGGTTLADRKIIAAGGGGSAFPPYKGGDGGGDTGFNGVGGSSAGHGGAQTSGGGGSVDAGCANGSIGLGGSAGDNSTCSGGGGGYYGGGSGGASGGGSSYIGGVANGVYKTEKQSGDGVIIISYNVSIIPNDDCPNPEQIYCGQSLSGSTIGANPDFPPCYDNANNGGGVWYSLTGLGQHVTLSTCNPGTDFDTKIGVFTGDCNEPICVAENDDAPGCGNQSEVTFFAANGGNYRVLIDGGNNEEGNFDLYMLCGNPCEDAVQLSCTSDTYIGNTITAPYSTAPTCSSNANGKARWIQFTATGQCATVSTCYGGTDFDTQLSIYSGTCGDLECVAYNDDDPLCPTQGSTVDFLTEVGETYYIVVEGKNNEAGTFSLSINCESYEPLIASCPPDITIACDEPFPAQPSNLTEFINMGGSISFGGCGLTGDDISIDVVDETYEVAICTEQHYSRIFTATNLITGEYVTCTQGIIRAAAPEPTLTSNGPLTIECAEDLIFFNFESIVTASFNGSCIPEHNFGATIIQDNQISCNGNQTMIQVTLFDECGRTASTDVIVNTINDGLQITCPSDEEVLCYDHIIYNTLDATVTNPCGLEYDISASSPFLLEGVEGQAGAVYAVKYTAENNCGESVSCLQRFTVQNGNDIVMVCPADRIVECVDDIFPEPNLVDVTTPCGEGYQLTTSNPVLIQGQANCSNAVYQITYTASTDEGLMASCTQQFTLENDPIELVKIDPYLTNISNGELIQIQCYSLDPNWEIPQFDTDAVSAITSCNKSFTIDYQPSDLGAGNCAIDGYLHRYLYNWLVTDECGTTAQFSFTIELIDEIAPVLSGVPADVTIECNDEFPQIPTVTASDECECECNHVQFSEEEIPSGFCNANRIVLRRWIAEDNCGNQTEAVQYITITDTQAPTVNYFNEITAEQIPDQAFIEAECSTDDYPDWVNDLNETSIFVSDICSENFDVSFELNPVFHPTCSNGNYLEQYTPTWLVTDECGNTTTFSFTVNVMDNTPPAFNQSDVLYLCDGNQEGWAYAIDDCTNHSMYSMDEPIPGCGSAFINRTYYIEDDCGNHALHEQLVVDLTQRPDLITLEPDVDFSDEIYECDFSKEKYTDMTAEDVVPLQVCLTGLEINFSETVLPGSCEEDGMKIQLLWTATTPCGYTDTLEYLIDIIDNEAPYFVDFEPEVELACGSNMPSILAIDDCSEVNLTFTETEDYAGCSNEKTVYRTITATDACGKTSTAYQTVVFIDNEGPVFNIPTSVCSNEAPAIVFAYDQCSDQQIEATLINEQDISECSEYELTEKTWQAIDECGNVSVFVQQIYSNDFQVTFEIIDNILNNLVDNNTDQIYQSNVELLTAIENLHEYSVVAYDPCGNLMEGVFSYNLQEHDSCINGVNQTLELSWIYVEVCGVLNEYNLSFDIINDMAPVIDLDDELTLYCTEELPELNLIEAPGVNYEVELFDFRNEWGDGIIQRRIVATDVCGNSTEFIQTLHYLYTSNLQCSIEGNYNPECNSARNIYTVDVSGGTAPYTINWIAVGNNCAIEATYGNTAEVYIGYGEASIIAEVTDANGCLTTCEAVISCIGYGLTTNPNAGPTMQNKSEQNPSDQILDESFSVKVFPNPFTSAFTLNIEATLEGPFDVLVKNSLGNTVYAQVLNPTEDSSIQISLKHLPTGVYYAIVQHEELREVIQIIKVND